MVKVYGKLVDDETRCEHYHSFKDILAIKFYCCHNYYPCYKCHREATNHPIKRWPKEGFSEQAIFCGVCKSEFSINAYLKTDTCPECSARFNENCSMHHGIYFEV